MASRRSAPTGTGSGAGRVQDVTSTTDQQRLADVEQAVKASDLARGIALARQALADGVEHPLLLNLRALDFERQGQLDAALADLERARTLAPRDWGLANALGLCLAQLDRMTDAVLAFDEAIRLQPAFVQAHFNRGWALENGGDLIEARLSFEQAVALKPDYADALAKLAQLAARRGQHDEVAAYADQALKIAPGHPSANLALATAEVSRGEDKAAEARLRQVLADAAVPPFDRAMAFSTLGNALDAQDRVAEAFAAYADANAVLRQIHAPRFDAPGLQTATDYVRMLEAHFGAAPADFWRSGAGLQAPAPVDVHVFLLGFPRSGTTLLESVLASHPDVTVLEEKDTLGEATRDLMRNAASLERLTAASDEALDAYRASYWRYVQGQTTDGLGRVVIDKLPLNTVKLPLISRLFPQARIIFAVRDPRDVVLSCFRRQFRMNPSMFEFLSLDRAAAFYDAVMRFGDVCLSRIELPVHTHYYEQLVTDFEATARQVCEFVDVPWTEALWTFADRAREGRVATTSSPQVARGLYTDAKDQWRRYQAELASVTPLLRPWVDRFGYPAA